MTSDLRMIPYLLIPAVLMLVACSSPVPPDPTPTPPPTPIPLPEVPRVSVPVATMVPYQEAERLKAYEYVRYALLGVELHTDTEGVVILTVFNGTPAHEAGLRYGDYISGIGGRQVSEHEEVTRYVRSSRPGDIVTVTILRDETEMAATVRLGERWVRP